MTSHDTLLPPRAVDLLCDRALWGLDDDEDAELERILREGGKDDDITFALAAAAVDLAAGPAANEALPPRLERIVLGTAITHVANQRGAQNVVALPKRRAPAWLPWLAAAACLVLALGGWLRSLSTPNAAVKSDNQRVQDPAVRINNEPGAVARRQALLDSGARALAWSTTKDKAAQGASGDVVWDNDKQQGYMRFRGLAANNPSESQYQLWIFDKAKDERYPVDGGVFDVDPTTGDVVVTIRPKLQVVDPTLFAVTVEKPGGVVVSSRERIVVTAAVAPG